MFEAGIALKAQYGADQVFDGRGVEVENAELVACLEQVVGHGRAHVAQADEANGLGHGYLHPDGRGWVERLR